MRAFRLVALAAGVVGAYVAVGRRHQLAFGSTTDEREMPLPGDDAVEPADLVATRAITIHASASEVWPWIAQMGQGRGGLYSYDAIENLVGCEMRSADTIVDRWQDVVVGDRFGLHPKTALEVVHVDRDRALVVRGGVPEGSAPYAFSWAFVLLERLDGTTRLVVRERYRYLRRFASLIVEPVEVVDFVMTQKMLRGIRDRAERTRGSLVATASGSNVPRARRGPPARPRSRTARWSASVERAATSRR
jgi:hypothetical protein